MADDPLPLRRRLTATRLALAAEALLPALLPGLGVVGLFLALALGGVFGLLPGTLHAVLLGLFGLALVLGWRRVPAALRLPAEPLARRRLETDNAVPHRALETLEDTLSGSGPDPVAEALWQAHRERAAQAAARLRLHGPRPVVARHDPWALRALVVLALVVTGIAAGPEAPERLRDALVPHFGKPAAGAAGDAAGYTAWITPPAYTRLPPLYLGEQGQAPGQPLRIAAGSIVMARLHGVGSGGVAFGEDIVPLDAIETGSFAGEVPVRAGDRLRFLDGTSEIASWPLEVLADKAPTVAFAAPPSATERQALRIAYLATDDYGVAGVQLSIRLAGRGEPLVVPLGGATGRPEAKSVTFRDLTAHPWAGLEVTLELTATDALDQTGHSAPVIVTLPERQFRHPVARAIIEQRKRLVAKPAERRQVALALGDIAARIDAYGGRMPVYLGLTLSAITLFRNAEKAKDAEVVDLLWEIALDLDEGRVPNAQAALRAAQDALEEALQSGASDAEIARLMEELRQAMAEYLQALAEEAMRRGFDQAQPLPGGDMMTSRDLERMLDEAQRAAESGSREAARQMLQNLREMLENLQAAQGMMQNGDAQALNEGMNQLNDMLREQGQLRDQSFAEQQRREGGTPGQRGRPGQQQSGQQQPGQGQPGQSGQPGDLSGQAESQEGLRQQLGDLLRQLDEAGLPLPDALTRAERAMDQAREALEGNNPGAAAAAQGEALSALREGMQALGEQMAQQLGIERGQGRAGSSQPGSERDPLGRPRPGRDYGSGDDVRVPTEAEARRVREILDELQRRAGDRSRSQDELDYIRRLLERF
ncbi:TIGR02302 family protein [Zavarzinia compransoris]|uniref:TIGR02302 family protein n=1 Tax=Zavarzinia compransoris TaxID=1264899 RepID=A0A317E5Y6_9PROT|nr:TIGR02302 family protein [Zavarzinia compransoris]PWR21754.1 TIGR02302 family protein [Zavarzinia compransoris]TDP45453.1 uncharacterized protein (TIGR02302 family) [Zavarzinia compransoris]